jgi:hypothetical protein
MHVHRKDAIALFYTIITFRRTKRLDQITLSTHVFNELRELDRELAKIPPELNMTMLGIKCILAYLVL